MSRMCPFCLPPALYLKRVYFTLPDFLISPYSQRNGGKEILPEVIRQKLDRNRPLRRLKEPNISQGSGSSYALTVQ